MRAVVIGAGVAGIAAARALSNNGIEVVVLEASERIGGRTKTVALGGGHVDVGASWIHAPVGNPLTALCRQLGIATRPFALDDVLGSMRLVDADGDVAGPMRSQIASVEAGWWSWLARTAAMAPERPLSSLLEEYFVPLIDGIDPSASSAARWARDLARTAMETDLCAPCESISAENVTADKRPYGGGDDVVAGGYVRLVERLAEGLAVQRGALVDSIAHGHNGVRVGCGAVEHHADVAIVTVSLGVLEHGSIRFDPPLSSSKRSAIERLGFGAFEKVVLQFDEAWWRTAAHPASSLHLGGEPTFRYWLDVTPTVGTPTLAAHVAGPCAARLPALASERIDGALAALRRNFGRVPDASAATATDWSNDPNVRGGYSRHTPSSRPSDIAALAAPHGRVLFAGEATSAHRYGYVDGAYESGRRAAHEAIVRAFA